MEYTRSWQSVVAAANCKGETSFSRPTHYTHIACHTPTCRSVWWRLTLGVLPKNSSEWLSTLRKQRQEYEDLRRKLSVTPGIEEDQEEDLSLNNPLSQDTQSSWNQYFEDSELKRLIRQDVERTFPEERFFHTPLVQETLLVILFCYAREHPDVGFKQGLHEILAPLLLVLHSDYQDYQTARSSSIPIVQEVMDSTYMEHDAYWLLCGVMRRLSKWYLSRDDPPPHHPSQPHLHQLLYAQPFSTSPLDSPVDDLSPLLARIHHIHTKVLGTQLPQIAEHLKNLEIPPQVYAIRWLRLLFGREFSLPQLMIVWDAIFWCSTEKDFPLVDYMAVTLLGNIQNKLLGQDYLACLNLLMRFPHPNDVTQLVSVALNRYTSASSVHSMSRMSSSSNRTRCNSGDELESSVMHDSNNSFSSLPYIATEAHHTRPSTLPHLNINAPSSSGRLNTTTNGSTSFSADIAAPISGASQSSTAVPGVQRGQSVHSSMNSRSRSQVMRCASEGGGGGITSRHPSASPRRPVNNDPLMTYSRDTMEQLSPPSSSNKPSNLLNFVKFSTVKFSKPKEGYDSSRASSQTSAESKTSALLNDANIPKQLEDLSSVGFTKRKAPPVPDPSKTRSINSSSVISTGSHTQSVKDLSITDQLQQLAGELAGHLSALRHCHEHLKVNSDLTVQVTMDRLMQVSAALQKLADSEPNDGAFVTPNDCLTQQSFISHPLEHNFQPSPD